MLISSVVVPPRRPFEGCRAAFARPRADQGNDVPVDAEDRR